MRKLLSFLAAAVFLGTGIPAAQAREPVTLDFFYDNLESSGIWQEVGDYGYCWRPNNVDQNWRPYSDGRWLYTDAGWTWDSDEPYGWAVYHYGRWADVDQVGWVWVPGLEWGPGWVSWRHSSRYVGWAPLPPEAIFRVGIGFSSWVDNYYDIGPSNYRFIEGRNFGGRRMNSFFVDPRENMSIMRSTTNITSITYQDNMIHNGGLRFDQLSRQSAEPLQRYKLDRRQGFAGDPRNQAADQLRSRVSGNSLSVFAVPFAGTTSAPRKLSEKVGNAQVNHGWKNTGSPEDVAAVRTAMKSKVSTPRELPAQPKFENPSLRPSVANVQHATDHTPTQTDQTSKPNVTRDNKATNGDKPPATLEKRTKTTDHPATLPNGAKHDKINLPTSPALESTDNAGQGGKNRMNNNPNRGHTPDVPPANVERKPVIPNTEPQHARTHDAPPANIERKPVIPNTEPQHVRTHDAPPANIERKPAIQNTGPRPQQSHTESAPHPQPPAAAPRQPENGKGQPNGKGSPGGKDKQKSDNNPG